MIKIPLKSWRIANLLLILIVIMAQTGAIAHAYEHDLGTPQDTTCSSCLTSTQLLGANVDCGANQLVLPPKDRFLAVQSIAGESLFAVVPRQRGPPVLL